MQQVTVTTPGKSYGIWLERDFSQLEAAIKGLNKNYSRIAVISDDQVGPLYIGDVKAAIADLGLPVFSHMFTHGEEHKHYGTMNEMYRFLIENQFDRKTLLIALGGGVTGDMVGFLAATYMRGVDFVQVPTSLLAQVDSSSGGKTGIDFEGYKNIVGAFYQPELVYISTETLRTLPKAEFANGMGEAIKHGLIQDYEYFHYIKEHSQAIQDLEHEAIAKLIGRSVEIKANVVSQDEKEHGLRAILNFGHTIGHAVEKMKEFKLFHGQCVGLGIVASTYISLQLGELTLEEREEILEVLRSYHLLLKTEGLLAEDVYQELFYDKKTSHSTINIVLLKGIGTCYQNTSLSKELIMSGIEAIL